MRLIRWAGENVSPSDDGRLYEKIFGDGLLADVDMTPAGAAKINIGPIYGIICGREFTTDAMQINAALPSSGTKYGTIYAEIDTSKSSPLSIKTSISQSWTPTRQDINVSGTVAQVAIGWYGATPTAVTQAESNWPIEGENGVLKRATVREVLERLYYMATNHQNSISGLTTEVTRLNNDLTNLIRSSTATITTNTAGAVVGGPEAFGMPAGAVLLAAYFNRGNYGATRNVTVSMYGASGYRMDFTDGTSAVISQSVSLTCYYIMP